MQFNLKRRLQASEKSLAAIAAITAFGPSVFNVITDIDSYYRIEFILRLAANRVAYYQHLLGWFCPGREAHMASSSGWADLDTPPKCTADFCLIPLGTPSASVSKQIADVQRLLRQSGVKYSMHSAGTTLEGSWDEVTRLIGQAHTLLHGQGIVRIQTDIRIGSRTDKTQGMADKVEAVNRLLADDKDAK